MALADKVQPSVCRWSWPWYLGVVLFSSFGLPPLFSLALSVSLSLNLSPHTHSLSVLSDALARSLSHLVFAGQHSLEADGMQPGPV